MAPSKPRIGRPPRTDNPQRLVVWVPGMLRRFLEEQSAREKRTMGALVADALALYRERIRARRKPR